MIWFNIWWQRQIQIYFGSQKRANTTTNRFGWTKKEEYNYEFILANMNTNTNIWTGILKDEYEHEYSSHTALESQGHYRVCLDAWLSVRAGKKHSIDLSQY